MCDKSFYVYISCAVYTSHKTRIVCVYIHIDTHLQYIHMHIYRGICNTTYVLEHRMYNAQYAIILRNIQCLMCNVGYTIFNT